MSKNDWFRNQTWSLETKDAFYKMLAKKKDKSQYLVIQAVYLREKFPLEAIALMQENIESIGSSEKSSAYNCIANSFLYLNNFKEAVVYYKKSITHEKLYPNCTRSDSLIEFPFLVARKNLTEYFDEAFNLVINLNPENLILGERFKWAFSLAIIFSNRGEIANSKEFAIIAKNEMLSKQASNFASNKIKGSTIFSKELINKLDAIIEASY